jgi:predicted ArsR family transcriptional regulator
MYNPGKSRKNKGFINASNLGDILRKLVRSGVIRRSGNEKRGRGRPNLTWEESVKRDLKN